MYSTDTMQKLRAYTRNSKGELRKIGRVRATVFHPVEHRAIGYVIKRPDALLMIKRDDLFAAFDRVEIDGQSLIVDDVKDAWDKAACKRMGVDYDTCVIWDYMPVRTQSGRDLGTVGNVLFDETTGEIHHIDISSNAAVKAILGSSDISREHLHGYSNGAIVVDDLADDIEESGGAAAKAGVAWATTKHAASEGAKIAGEAINDGAYKAGELIGSARDKIQERVAEQQEKNREAEANGEYTGVDKAANLLGQQLGKAGGMFRGFKEEFDKASKGE